MIPFSVLDLSPITEGSSAAESFRRSRELAQHAESLGFQRYWLAEHHGMPGIASAATSILIAHVAAGTSRIRVGSGGIMLPNHSPLVIAEQFGTLEALYPGRIDLGLGRAPGSDPITSRALRRHLDSDPDAFPRDVLELMDFMSDEPQQRVLAVPGQGAKVPVWILGSSLYGAQVAAAFGLPYAFASHFAPQQMMPAIELYRSTFKPSAQLARPHVMLGFNLYAAPTDEEAQFLASSWQQSFVSLRSGRPVRLPPPVEGYTRQLGPAALELLDQVLSCAAVGGPETVTRQLQEFIDRTRPDELMLTCNMYDPQARHRSFAIAAEIQPALRMPATVTL